jgi:V8-like Glu-specific endopeptidase
MMLDLTIQDRQDMILMLQRLPEMAGLQGRRQLLEFAGLQAVIPQITLGGAPFVAASSIVNFLADYGRLSYDNEALGLFLNTLKSFVGVEQQTQIDGWLRAYQMMEPIASADSITDWQGGESDDAVLEKVFGENTLRPIAFLARGLEVSRAVALLRVSDGGKAWLGTGFMIAPDLMMTNHHVIGAADLLPNVSVRFNYQEDFHGQPLPIDPFRAKVDGIFHASDPLDYAIFQLEEAAGDKWGYLPLAPRSIRPGARINIIQHPHGQPKQISMQNNLVEFVGGNVIQYVTSTNPGSSGSPSLNDEWLVVGLHHAGGYIRQPGSWLRYNRNESIQISRILADLPADLRARVAEAAVG